MDVPVGKATQARVRCHEILAMLDRLEQWRPEIDEALARCLNVYTFDEIVDKVLKGELITRFWDDAFMIVTLHRYPRAKHYHIFLSGGNLQTLIAAGPEVEADAKAAGCQRITVNGRSGWTRALKASGAKLAYTMLVKDIDDGT